MLSMSQLCGKAVKKVHVTLSSIYTWIMPGLPDFRMDVSQTSEPTKRRRCLEVLRVDMSGLNKVGRMELTFSDFFKQFLFSNI